MENCLDLGKKVNNKRLDDQQVLDIFNDLQRARDPQKAANMLLNIEDAMFQRGTYLVEGADLARKVEKRGRYLNIIAEHRLMELAERADSEYADPSLGLEAALVGVNASGIDGNNRSVAAVDSAIFLEHAGGLIADLKKDGLHTAYVNMRGQLEREVSRVLSDLNMRKPTNAVDASPEAVKIGKIMFKYQRSLLERQNRSGAYIRLKEGRVVQASHDPGALRKYGYDEWRDFIVKNDMLDFDRMDIAPERIERFLELSYASIESGIRIANGQTTDDIAKAFKGPMNLAKRQSASGVFTFKDADAWYDYDQKFGRGSLREAFMQDMQSASRSSALMETFGTNPEAMLDKVRDRLLKKHRKNAKKVSRLRRDKAFLTLDAAMAEVTGSVNIGSSSNIAQWTAGFRNIQTMAKLGGSFISALSDVGFIATNRMYQGRSMVDAWGDAFGAVFRGMNKGQMRDFADRMGVGLEGQLGDFFQRFNPTDNVNGRLSKTMGTFFKLNLLQPWTESNKRGVSLMIANDLGREAGKSFDKLPSDLQRVLGSYGIDKASWKIARKGVRKGPDKRDYIFPGDIEDTKVRESIFALLVTEADFSVPSPGARERAILRRGYRPGTAAGESIRFVTQFKSFGVTALTKVLGRQVYGYGGKTLADQLKKGAGANLGLANAIIGTSFLGYFVMQAKEVMRGKEPRPATPETFMAAMMQGGGLGLYGDFLFAETNRFGGGGFVSDLLGPSVSTVGDFSDLLIKAKNAGFNGEKNLGGDAVRLVKNNTPFANLFYTKQAMDYLLWYHLQEMANPGYLQRSERRSQSDSGQGFLARPSDVIQYGGGFK